MDLTGASHRMRSSFFEGLYMLEKAALRDLLSAVGNVENRQ